MYFSDLPWYVQAILIISTVAYIVWWGIALWAFNLIMKDFDDE